MRNTARLTLCLLYVFIFISTKSSAQDNLKFPTPSGNPNQLFFLQRSQNTNTVVYELNLKNDILDTIAPIHIFWICYAEKGQTEELTNVQKKYAYGLAVKHIGKDHYQLTFAADKKHVAELMKGPDNKYHVYDQINQKRVILSSIYLQIHGGSLFSPHIEYISLKGIDPETGADVFEKKKT